MVFPFFPNTKQANPRKCWWTFQLNVPYLTVRKHLLKLMWPTNLFENAGYGGRLPEASQEYKVINKIPRNLSGKDYLSGQITATSHRSRISVAFWKGNGRFQGNLGGWNIIIWPDLSIRLGKTIVLGRLNFVNDFTRTLLLKWLLTCRDFDYQIVIGVSRAFG